MALPPALEAIQSRTQLASHKQELPSREFSSTHRHREMHILTTASQLVRNSQLQPTQQPSSSAEKGLRTGGCSTCQQPRERVSRDVALPTCPGSSTFGHCLGRDCRLPLQTSTQPFDFPSTNSALKLQPQRWSQGSQWMQSPSIFLG